jgi:hypothetical protein
MSVIILFIIEKVLKVGSRLLLLPGALSPTGTPTRSKEGLSHLRKAGECRDYNVNEDEKSCGECDDGCGEESG